MLFQQLIADAGPLVELRATVENAAPQKLSKHAHRVKPDDIVGSLVDEFVQVGVGGFFIGRILPFMQRLHSRATHFNRFPIDFRCTRRSGRRGSSLNDFPLFEIVQKHRSLTPLGSEL